MHARELIDLAAVVAVHAPVLLRVESHISESSVEGYWVASKCRLDRWGRFLKKFTTAIQSQGPMPNAAEQRAFRSILEEILASEVLTRVWSAAMCAYDRVRGTDRMEPVARSVLIGQIEARHRVLTILVSGSGLAPEEAMRLDALRRRTERWTDVLVGYLTTEHNVREFAVDPQRAGEFAADFAQKRCEQGGRFAWAMVAASLQAAFREWLEPSGANPDLNAKIAAAILNCLPPEVFDEMGTIPSQWLLRISHVTNEAEGMIEELLGDTSPPRGPRPQPAGRERFRRRNTSF